jgi:hypothetical protein
MTTVENASVAGTVAVVGLGTSLFTAFMPAMADIRTSKISRENATQVRHGQIMGTVTTLAFASVVGYWAHSTIPVLAGVVTAVTLSMAYELSLREMSLI